MLAECRAAADEMVDDHERLVTLTRLLPFTSEAKRQERAEHVVWALQSAPDLTSPSWMLLKVVKHLATDAAIRTWQRILSETSSVDDEESADIVAAMADDLPEQLLPDVLTIVRGIDNEMHRAYALVVLSDRLTGALLQNALGIASAISAAHCRTYALSGVAGAMSDAARSAVLRQALSIARDTPDDEDRSWALLILVPLLLREREARWRLRQHG